MKFLHAAILTILLVLMPIGAVCQETDWSARIDSPFAAPLWRLATTGEEDFLAVSSADETVTTWSLDQELARDRIVLPRRKTLNYRARGLAIHPSTGIVATSAPPVVRGTTDGAAGARIELWSAIGGSFVHRIESDLPTRPQSLAFSPDGKWLAAVLSEGCGLRLWATEDWSLAYADDEEHGGCGAPQANADTTELRFISGVPLALLTSGETGIRRYEYNGANFTRTAYRPSDELIQRPDGLAVSPDRMRIAVGDRRLHDPNRPLLLSVSILDVKSLEVSAPPLILTDNTYFYEAPDLPESRQIRLNRVVWEEGLVSAGGMLPCKGVVYVATVKDRASPQANCLVRWQPDQTAEPSFLPVGDEAVMDMLPLPSRRILAVATQNRVALYERDGASWIDDYGNVFEETSPFADFRPGTPQGGGLLAFDVSESGEQVFFQHYPDGTELTFDVGNLTLTSSKSPEDGLRQPDIDSNLFGTVLQWLNSRAPAFAPQDLLLENDVLRSVAAFDKGRFAIVGTANTVQVINVNSRKVVCRLRVTAEAFRVNVAQDRRLAIVGHGDGTLRWYAIDFSDDDTCSLEEILAVNIRRAVDDPGTWTWHAWIAETGRFAHDAAAKPDMSWQRTKEDGTVDLVDFNTVSSLYDRDAVMAALKPKARIDPQPDTAKKTREDAVDEQIAQNKTMSVKVVGPIGHDATLVNNQVSLTFKIEGQGPWPRPLDILVNGKIGVEKKLNGNDYAANEPIQVSGPGMLEVVIKLPERVQRNWGHFELCFVVNGRLINECSTLTWKGDKIPPPKPRLWAVLVGFSDYSQGRRGTLKYAQNDALDLARLLASDYKASSADPGSGDFSDLHIDLIVAPTSQDARNEVEQLKALPFVTVREPSVASVIAAIEAIAKHDEKEGLVDDLVLVAYSGHGTSVKGTAGRNTLLLDPLVPDDLDEAINTGKALALTTLIDKLSTISAEQIVLVDACRSFSQVNTSTTIDPAFENTRLAARANPAHVVFSARVGQYSPESSQFAFSKHRAGKANGNGIFAYAILDALRNPDADILDDAESVNRIEIDEVKLYLGSFFRGPAQKYFDKVRKLSKRFVPPEPVWIPSGGLGRTVHNRTFLRTLIPSGN